MGWNDHLMDQGCTYEHKCPYCGEIYICSEYPQTPGFRDMEDEVCPYCKKTVRKSMEYEFTTWKRGE